MIKFEHSITINKPVAEVYAFCGNPANDVKWSDGLVETRVSGPLAVGSQYTEVRKFLGRELESTLEVTALEPNKKWGAKVVKGPVQFELLQTFEAAGSGTKTTIMVEGEPGGFFKLAEGMVKKQLEASITGDSERLKKVLEG